MSHKECHCEQDKKRLKELENRESRYKIPCCNIAIEGMLRIETEMRMYLKLKKNKHCEITN